ncbi:DNA adenine methylase [Peptostreptococcus anaerobius]|uniref:DNA adenine methylase n=1 Tax=Peptostreptococcus anaerobius TaxID=1261 RepID=UPI00321C32F5
MTIEKLHPFVKWAGGKRQLLPKIKERMPNKFNDYYEPFIGGGAVLFELQPKIAVINDINKALITSYITIRDNPDEFINRLNNLDINIWEDGKEYFYDIRSKFNTKVEKNEYDVELASLFVFLNKHCFNGLYRVNSRGLFNVPYNNSRRPSFDENHIKNISIYLRGIDILNCDFEEACKDYRIYLMI